MKARRFLALAVAAIILFTASTVVWAEGVPSGKTPPAVDQRALDILKKMSDTLSQAKTVSFQARSMVPIKTPDGTWINLYGASRVVMQGPDKLFASTGGDFAPYDFYFDGKTITAYSPIRNLYAVKPAAATIDAMIEEAYRVDGKSFPYADILVSEPYKVLTEGVRRAFYVGQSTIQPLSGAEGIKTDHLVFLNKNVEWQIWIGADDHLPRLVCATYLEDAREPSYTVEFGGWKLNGEVSPEAFVFNNASKAPKVEFRNPMLKRRAPLVGTAVKE